MKKTSTIWGFVFIAFGAVLLLNQFFPNNIINIEYLWPVFVLIPGLSMEIGYFSKKKNPGVLVPGGILTVIGILFFFEVFTDWRFSEYTWPFYLLSVAFGLLQLYLFSKRNKGLLIPIAILTVIALSSFLSMIFNNFLGWVDYSLVVPIIFILFGVYILAKRSNN
ncbi:LiaF transmembrane domain-containing protein [Haloimpatiens sp. FM7315]|uniref:LiaF transmembrane domain-containing protein n=1 Tax=Haloimpatiens sp. FM7315 TaxID=3298609 RepID=UPI00370B3CEC